MYCIFCTVPPTSNSPICHCRRNRSPPWRQRFAIVFRWVGKIFNKNAPNRIFAAATSDCNFLYHVLYSHVGHCHWPLFLLLPSLFLPWLVRQVLSSQKQAPLWQQTCERYFVENDADASHYGNARRPIAAMPSAVDIAKNPPLFSAANKVHFFSN